jgi:ribosomal 50S subunit-recycling heat shock protein
MRLDLALFGLRLFKSRSQATEAIQEGRVLLNRRAVKPSHETRPGDRVTLLGHAIPDEGSRTRTLEILELPRGSLSRERARALVRETPDD